MRAVLGIGIALGGVALLAYVVYGVRLGITGGNTESTASLGGDPNNPTAQQDKQHKGTSTGGTQ